MEHHQALALLRCALGNPAAEFREGQWEAIDRLVNQREKALVVERTGWGKSAVYFISARILRDQDHGMTLIISPLLALMRNQVEAARRLGLNAETINSGNRKDWKEILERARHGKVDCLLISPERLANEGFRDNFLAPRPWHELLWQGKFAGTFSVLIPRPRNQSSEYPAEAD